MALRKFAESLLDAGAKSAPVVAGAGLLATPEEAEAGLLNVAYKNLREAAQDAKRSEAMERGFERGKRKMAEKVKLSAAEKKAIVSSIKGKGVTQKKALQYARDWKMRHPLDEWDVPEITGLTVNDKGSLGIKTKNKKYGYNIDPTTNKPIEVGSPRFNEISDNLVNEIVEIAKRAQDGDPSAQRIMNNQGWYKNVEGRLRNEYGSFADMMGDILGATSPNTPVATNFRFSQDILNRATRGDFDELMNGFADALDRRYALQDAAADYLQQQKAAGVTIKKAETHPKYLAMMQEAADISKSLQDKRNVIRQTSGKQYGINSYNSMIALADRWRVLRKGGKPKAKNFSGNVTGRSEQATIDVWAARNLRKHAGLKPIPSAAEGTVTGNITDVDNFRNSLEFGFGQDVIADATAKINQQLGTQLEPRDVQALQWFAEKDHWTKKGWTSPQGEGGSFETMMDADPVESLFLGISREQSEKFQGKDFVPTAEESKNTAQKIISAGADDPDVRAVKGMPTLGKYMDDPETAMDIDVVSREDMLPTGILENAARQAVADQQDSFFVARRIPDSVGSQNLESFNVGTEIYFKDGVSPSSPLIKDIQKELNAQNVPAYTLIVDPRDANRVIGMRYLDIPQFDDPERFATMSPEIYGEYVREKLGVYDELGRNLRSKFPSIKASEAALFDVNVKPRRQTEDYVAQLSMEGADADALNTEFFGYRPATDRFREYVGDDKAYDTRVRSGPGGTKGERGSITPGGLLGAGAVGAASTPTFQDKAVAFGETLLDAGQAMIAPIAAAPHALIPALTSDRPTAQIEQGYQNLLQQQNYEPSTQLGQEYSQAAQQFMGDAFNAAAQSAPGQAIKQVVEPINLLMQQAPDRARLIGRSLLDMSPF